MLAGAAPTFVDPADLAAAPGERAPHVWVHVDGRRCSTLDLWDGRLTVVTADPTWRAAAEDLALAAPDLAGPRLVSAYRLGDGGAVLVRPDGYVAWRADVPVADPVGALTDAVDLALGLTGARANGEFVRLRSSEPAVRSDSRRASAHARGRRPGSWSRRGAPRRCRSG